MDGCNVDLNSRPHLQPTGMSVHSKADTESSDSSVLIEQALYARLYFHSLMATAVSLQEWNVLVMTLCMLMSK